MPAKRLFNSLGLVFLCVIGMHGQSLHTDSVYQLSDVDVVVQKDGSTTSAPHISGQLDRFSARQLEEYQVVNPKDVAACVPNLSMPDYGSAMTSSIYFRGLGSRIDQPAVGFIMDGVPLLDKNAYDQSLMDVRYVAFHRGPQGTLYGRNTMAGLLEVESLHPLDLMSQQLRARVQYGTANTVRADVGIVRPESERMGWSLYARYGRTDGFYRNSVNNQLVDNNQSAAGKFGLDFAPSPTWRIQTQAHADWITQGAFPYCSAETKKIAFSDPSSYSRLLADASMRATYDDGDYRLRLVAAYQYLGDDMKMDQDYSAERIFTLNQQQQQHAALVDVFLSRPRQTSWYGWSLGLNSFFKNNVMHAPVTFLEEGVNRLILSNANAGIRKIFPNDSLVFRENNLLIDDDFLLRNAGVAVYHQSEFRPLPYFYVDLGLRLDMEYADIHYDAGASLHYRMTAFMPDYRPFRTAVVGKKHDVFFQCLPRLSLRYEFPQLTLYVSAAKGSKAGGYNTQMFSTIVQNRMMQELMDDMGVHLDSMSGKYTDVSISHYKPESAWNYEFGMHCHPRVNHGRLRLDADVFYIRVRNQQLTVFPEGNTTGRIMTNAARSRSWGGELSLGYDLSLNNWNYSLDCSYGFTDARFISYKDATGDYSNKVVPYTPRHTVSLGTTIRYVVGCKWLNALSLSMQATAQGPFYWNESNTSYQTFYPLLNGTFQLDWYYASLAFWTKNVLDTDYNTFYFVSMSKAFYQRGLPRQLGLTITVRL